MNKVKDLKSIIVIFIFFLLNILIIYLSLKTSPPSLSKKSILGRNGVTKSEVHQFDYFHSKNNSPLLFLSAEKMDSLLEKEANFMTPKGEYYVHHENKIYQYQGKLGFYDKKKSLLKLRGDAQIKSEEGTYQADDLVYFYQAHQIEGLGHIKFHGHHLQNKDELDLRADRMMAWPQKKLSDFDGHVIGKIIRNKKFEGTIDFKAAHLSFDQRLSRVQMKGDVEIERPNYHVTAREGEIYLENFNKSLKYFVLNDDVKVTEKMETLEGEIKQRKAFAEKVEGFGRDEKMVLSGAPRVETDSDTIKGYQITLRENVELIEVDDAMSDVQVRKKKSQKKKDENRNEK